MLLVQERISNQKKENLYYSDLLDRQMRERLSNRICREKGFTPSQSVEVVDGTIGFLKMCADHPDRNFSPSPIVDIGWHEFLMYTKEYQEFCQRIAGHFIHHSPTDLPAEVGSKPTIRETLEFMVAHSISFHVDQWQFGAVIDAANCNNHCENNGDCNSK